LILGALEQMSMSVQQSELPDAVAFARGLVFAATHAEPRTRAALLRKMLGDLRRKLNGILEAGDRAVKALHEFLRSPETETCPRWVIQTGISTISRTITLGQHLLRESDELATVAPEFKRLWVGGGIREKFASQLEELEDVQETLALGLNEEFRSEVDAALQEAGISVQNVVVGRPTSLAS
jgi:hypothetical protein